MGGKTGSADRGLAVIAALFVVLVSGSSGQQALNNPAALGIFSELINTQIKNFTALFKDDIKKNYGFCITDV